MTRVIDAEKLARIVQDRGRDRRSLTAIAGPPGAGKSTIADQVADRLNAAEPGSAAVFPMDGFHYDDILLNERGWRARKGAPHTFDVAGFGHMLGRLRRNDEAEIAVPVFDRDLEIARAGARVIPSTARHLIVEGNYLLLQDAPWSDLATHFDTTVYLDVPMPVLTDRLNARWRHMPAEAIEKQLYGNDLPNAELVCARSVPGEFTIRDDT